MSIESMNAKAGPYLCDGVQSSFDFSFNALDSSFIAVYVGASVISSGGYSVVLNGSAGGTVTFPVAPDSGAKVAIIRNVPATQLTDIQNHTNFLPEVIEDALDKQVALIQQQQEVLDRVFMVPPTELDPDEALKQKIEEIVGSGGGSGGSGGSMSYAESAGRANVASSLVSGAVVNYALSAGVASALVSGATIGFAETAGALADGASVAFATEAATAGYANTAETANTASALVNGATASYAVAAGYAATAGTAGYANNAGSAGEAGSAGVASALVSGATVGYAESAGEAGSADVAFFASSAGKMYDGPFYAKGTTTPTTAVNVSVGAGAVVIGESRFNVAGSGTFSLPAGYDLYLSGSSYETEDGYDAAFGYVSSSGAVTSSPANSFLTKIAHNAGGKLQQVQYGEVTTVPWGISSGETPVASTYKGPFWVSAGASSGTTLDVTVRPGVVTVGNKRYGTPWLPHSSGGSEVSGTIALSAGYDLYLKGTYNNGNPTFEHVTTNSAVGNQTSGVFMTRLAYNSGGVIQQIQHGEITTVPWGIEGGTTSTTISGVMWPDLARKESVSAGSAGVAPDGGWILGHMKCEVGSVGNKAYVTIYNGSTTATATGSRMIELVGGLVYSGATSETVQIDTAISIPIPAGGRFEFTENANSNTIVWEYLKVHPIVGGSSIEMDE